jgi:UPF0755 protein
MKSKRLLSCLVICLALACVMLAGLVIASNEVNRRVTQVFGEPAENLSWRQRKMLEVMLLFYQKQLFTPYRKDGELEELVILPGEATPQILAKLWEAELIPDPAALRVYLQYTGLDTRLQPGNYRLSPALSPVEIALALQDASSTTVIFPILPGWRLEEIAAALPTSGLQITPEEFLQAAFNPDPWHPLILELPAGASLEGFMYPGVYEISRQAALVEIISLFLERFDTQVKADLRQGFERQGLNLYEAVTLASIVEREAVIDEEKPLIASVFLNRLAEGGRLDADPTVQYALGFDAQRQSWWRSPLSLEDLQVNSRYNTYLHAGLPPGPIASPTIESLRAVAFPAQTPYFYFRAACDDSGRHVFAESFQEHLNNACP